MSHYLVTGASSGIGLATAHHLAGLGHRVFLLGRDSKRLAAAVFTLPGSDHDRLSVDLMSLGDDGTATLLESLTAESGPFDGLVHAAGIHALLPLKYATSDAEMMRMNYGTAWTLAKAFRRPAVRTEKAAIVFISSVAGIVGQPATSQYAASKAALIGLTKALAIELAPDIRVNCVAPGVVRTPMQERLEGSMTPEQWQAVVAAHPLGIGTPEDVAQGIEYLLRQRWTTGTVLTIDGGYTSR